MRILALRNVYYEIEFLVFERMAIALNEHPIESISFKHILTFMTMLMLCHKTKRKKYLLRFYLECSETYCITLDPASWTACGG